MARPGRPAVSPALLVAAGVAVVVAVGIGVFNVLSGRQPAPSPAPPPTGRAAPASPSPTPGPAEVFEIFEGRDPFRPLVFEQPSPPAGGSPPPAATAAPTPRRGRTLPPTDGVQVEVLSVFGDPPAATVRVGSQVFTDVRPRRVLAAGVVAEAIEGRCVIFSRGGERFRLCEGQMVLK